MRRVSTDLGVACSVVRAGRLLLVKEAAGPHAGRWGIPKGYVDLNEAPEEAAKRELAEEVGLDGTIDGLIGVRTTLTPAGPAIFLCYAMSAPGEVRIDHGEISDHTWASPDEFDAVDWLSNTMLSLASASFSQGHLGLIDSTAARGRPYHLFTNAEVTT